MWNWIGANKTYILMGLGVGYAIARYALGDLSLDATIAAVLAALGVASAQHHFTKLLGGGKK